ncbi:MAG: hypothetical protein EOR57_31335 [Mesorhizobium sp.]|uniref:hypothetical protein n=1 Tax=Mesorhizobium sp. TaxID=1871066 RepID=UPI000FE59305|nr:hypothetical protein [Mesorhizobium sp.]RWL14840.1 MAG: hypothetical protein EOR57_31335 [Mesorhizobium sp.]
MSERNQGKKVPNGTCLRYFYDVVLPYDGAECLIWPFGKTSDGYGKIDVDGRTTRVSRVLCEKAHGPPPTPTHVAAHSCGKGRSGCVTKRHVRWATHQENEDDKSLHGTRPNGESHWFAKLTAAQVASIRALQGKATQKEIGEMFGVDRSLVGLIHNGKIWNGSDHHG